MLIFNMDCISAFFMYKIFGVYKAIYDIIIIVYFNRKFNRRKRWKLAARKIPF